MAGFGTRLKRLSGEDNLLGPVATIGHAAVIATGPWLFAVIALALISTITAPRVPAETVEGFRLLIIYAFSLSLVAASPIMIVATRLVGDAIYLQRFGRIKPLFLATLLLSGGAAASLAFIVQVFIFKLPAELAVAGVSSCGLVGLIWVGLAFCGAVRDYRGITLGFPVGLGVSVFGSAWAALSDLGAVGMVWGFEAGLLVVFCGLASRILTTFPEPVPEISRPLRVLWLGMQRFWQLALGGLFAATAIWIDKWVVWSGPAGEAHATGLLHAPLYDSAMFTACLVMIPALSLFVTHVETTFFLNYCRYYNAIRNHATLRQIESDANTLSQATVATLTNIVLVQAALCSIAVLVAPSIIETAGMHFQQVGILRLGVLGALFQFVFLAASSLLLFFNRHAHFLLLQTLFLLLQGGLTAITVRLGTTYYGFGNLIAGVACGLLALAVLDFTMRRLTFLTFILGSSGQSGDLDEALSNWDRDESNSGMKDRTK